MEYFDKDVKPINMSFERVLLLGKVAQDFFDYYYDLQTTHRLVGMTANGDIHTFKVCWRQGYSDNYYLEVCGQETSLDLEYIATLENKGSL